MSYGLLQSANVATFWYLASILLGDGALDACNNAGGRGRGRRVRLGHR